MKIADIISIRNSNNTKSKLMLNNTAGLLMSRCFQKISHLEHKRFALIYLANLCAENSGIFRRSLMHPKVSTQNKRDFLTNNFLSINNNLLSGLSIISGFLTINIGYLEVKL